MKVYFPNLNGLRFIAAFSVIISHVEMVKMVFGEAHHWDSKPVKLLGHLGVILFFVLSGFLITYLLLAEKKVSQTVSVKEFYIRRVLRIWPLYFLLILTALFIFPNIHFLDVPGSAANGSITWVNALLYLIILPNVAVKIFQAVPFIGHTWSIGVEEQFYLIWPWLVKFSKNVLTALIAVIVIYLIILFGLEFASDHYKESKGLKILTDIWHVSSIDCMAIGGLMAWLHFNKKKEILSVLRNHFMEAFCTMLIIGLVVKGVRFPYLHHEIYAILFSIIILNLATKKKAVVNLENKVFDFLGKISYGVYMYHVLCIVIAYKILKVSFGVVDNYALYGLSITLTLIIAALSYELFEYRFIRMKARFSKIISGDFARKS